MSTLVTGIPGSGKTLNTLEMVDRDHPDCQVYYFHIDECDMTGWEEITADQVHQWETFPDGSVFVIDECHKVWPRIPINSKSPPSVEALDEHRHRGFTFYLMTQKATKLDFRVRDMMDRHIHYERAFGQNMSRSLEFQSCQTDTSDYHVRQDALVKVKRFNKKYFDKYKSASMHTIKKRIPKKLYVIAASIVVVIALGVSLLTRLQARTDDDYFNKQVSSESGDYGLADITAFSGPRKISISSVDYVEQFTPRVQDMPLSAPAYDDVTEIKTYPRPQCMLNMRNKICKCFTQQATPLDISSQQCRYMVENGWFNPYKDEEGGGRTAQALAAVSPPEGDYYNPNSPGDPRIVFVPDGTSYPDRGIHTQQ